MTLNVPLRSGGIAVKLGRRLDGPEPDHESYMRGESCRWEYNGRQNVNVPPGEGTTVEIKVVHILSLAWESNQTTHRCLQFAHVLGLRTIWFVMYENVQTILVMMNVPSAIEMDCADRKMVRCYVRNAADSAKCEQRRGQ